MLDLGIKKIIKFLCFLFKDNTSPQAFPPCLLLSDDSDHQGSATRNADQMEDSGGASQGNVLAKISADDATGGLEKSSEEVFHMAEGMDVNASYRKGRYQICKRRRRKQRKIGKLNREEIK